MNKFREFKIRLLSMIDERLIDEHSAKRAELMAAAAKNTKKKIISIVALAASFVLILSALLVIVPMLNSAPIAPGAPVIVMVEKSESVDNASIYTIHYSDGTQSEFAVVNEDEEKNDSSILSLTVEDGELVAMLKNGESLNLGYNVGTESESSAIKGATSRSDGNIVLDFGDDRRVDIGKVGATNGTAPYVSAAKINDEGELVITFSTGQSVNLGRVVGKDGKDGVGIATIEITEEGELVITLTDGQIINLGNIRGEDGKSAYELYKDKYGYTGSEDDWLYDLANGLLAEKITYTVSFENSTDTPTAAQTVEKGEKVTEPQSPERVGYSFDGWYTQNGELWSFTGDTVTRDTVLSAKWNLIKYTITYTNEFDLASGPVEYTVESEEFTLPTPKRDGYEFIGWTTEEDGEVQPSVTIQSGTHGNVSFKANWSAVRYKVEYDLAGGTSADNPNSYSVEDNDISIASPTKEGYSFEGWRVNGSDTLEKRVVIKNNSMGDISLLAVWSPIEYEIYYTGIYGTNENPSVYTVESDTITLTEPKRTGYDFIGWTANDTDIPKKSFSISGGTMGDISLKANWHAINYAISYDTVGGSASPLPESYTIESVSFTLPIPTRSGYSFIGWKNGTTGTVARLTTVEGGSYGDISYTAVWKLNSYEIRYTGIYGTNENPISFTVEDADITVKAPKRDGYTFDGWSINGSDTLILDAVIDTASAKDVELVAHFTPIKYTISYDLAGGSLSRENPTEYTVETPSFVLNNPTLEDHVFAGWNSIGNTVVLIETGSTGNLEFTANWTYLDKKFSISYNLAGGTNVTNPTEYSTSSATKINNPIRDNYIFLGWTHQYLTEPTRDLVIPALTTGDLVLTANWHPVSYSITYVMGDGSFKTEPASTFTVADLPLSLPTPTLEGKYFIGWYFDSDFTAPAPTVTVAKDVTLYAKYSDTEMTAGLIFEKTGDSYAVSGYTGSSTKVVIPKTYLDLPVKSIANQAFLSSNATEILLPEGLETVGDSAFMSSRVKTVYLPSTLKRIGNNAFYETPLDKLTLPAGLEKIGAGAFYGTQLVEVDIPAGIRTLGGSIFSNAISLTKVTIADGYTEIPSAMFNGCFNLSSVKLPSTLLTIKSSAFKGCTSLQTVVIPNSLTSIGDYAFDGCGFSEIYLPDTVTSIEQGAFANCQNLNSITIPKDITTLETDVFLSCESLESVVLNEKLEKISEGALGDCSSLHYISIPGSVKLIELNAFISTDINMAIFADTEGWIITSFLNGKETTVNPNSLASPSTAATLLSNSDYTWTKSN